LPDWLPPGVRDWIVQNWSHPEHMAGREDIVGLANAPVMKRLWAELERKKRVGYVYEVNRDFMLHWIEASPEGRGRKEEVEAALTDAAICRSLAYQSLFRWLLHVAHKPGAAATEREALDKVDKLRARVAFLRAEAKDTEYLAWLPGNWSADWPEVAAGMRAKANFLESAIEAIPEAQPIIKNHRDNRQGLSAALKISTLFSDLFATPMYNFSAELATLLTEEQTTMEQVRAELPKQNPRVSFLPKRGENSQ
jgi:hypothetical protein